MGPAELVDREFGYIVGRADGRSGGRADGRAGGRMVGRADGRLTLALSRLTLAPQSLPKVSPKSLQSLPKVSPKSLQSLPKVCPKPPRLPPRPPEPNSSKNVKILLYSPTENWPKAIFEPDSIWFLDPPDALRVLSSIDLPVERIEESVRIITFS